MQRTYKLEDYLQNNNAISPSFSPSASKLIYLSNAGDDTYQIYLKDLNSDAEAVELTNESDDISFAFFSPASEETIFYGKAVDGNENYQLYRLNLTTNVKDSLTNNMKVRHNVGPISRDGAYLVYASNERNGTDFDTYKMNLVSKEVETIYAEGGWSYGSSISPSGRYYVVGVSHGIRDDDLYIVDLEDDNRQLKKVTENTEGVMFDNVVWREDETGFFAITDRENDFLHVEYYDVATAGWTAVVQEPWDIEGFRLSRAGNRLITIMNQDGYDVVRHYTVRGIVAKLEGSVPIQATILNGTSLSQSGTYYAYAGSDYGSASNIFVWDIDHDTHTKTTDVSLLVPKAAMVEPRLIHFDSFDSLSVPAFLFKPHIELGARAPVIINIHGGPEGQFRPGFAPVIQYLVSQGYAVVAPNVRGSTGYGKTYQALDDKRKRLDSVRDLAELHTWIRENDLDETKIGLMGGSYGGYMVLAGLAFYPDLWAAGVDIVGIANFVSYLKNTSPYRRKLREYEYGSLEEDEDFLVEISPINSIDKMKAPLIIIHGANDPRVPLNEAEQVRDALQAREIECEMYVYADEGHGIAKLRNRLDVYPRIVHFLDTVLKK